MHAKLAELADELQFKLNDPVEDEEHHTWSLCFTDSQGAHRVRRLESRLQPRVPPDDGQILADQGVPRTTLPDRVCVKGAATAEATAEAEEEEPDAEGAPSPGSAEVRAEAKATARSARALREPVEKQTARELFTYIVEQGKKDYQVQRYKGLGEMTASQLWETTMDPEHRTLLQVKLEDIAETEAIFTTLMGEDVEARRKFIEDNALDVKNLDI